MQPAVDKLFRSEFFEAKIVRWTDGKREIVLEDCDPEALGAVVDFMYGTDLPDMVMMNSYNILTVSSNCLEFNTQI